MQRIYRIKPLVTILTLAACPSNSGDETGGTDTNGTTAPMTSTTDDTSSTTDGDSTTTSPTTGTSAATTDETSSTATTEDPTEAGVCTLPPLADEVIQSLGFNVFGFAEEAEPGETLSLAVGAIECCYFKNPVEACVEYSVSPAEGASIDAEGTLTIAADAAPGSVFTVTADVEAGRKVLTTEVHVYTPESNPFVGRWHEVAQLPCGGGPEVAPEVPIGELWFRADGEVMVTWMPFEIYVDYWSQYTYDLMASTIEIVPESGNYLPADVEGAGNFTIEGNQLVLADMWLGTPQNSMKPALCGHRFER